MMINYQTISMCADTMMTIVQNIKKSFKIYWKNMLIKLLHI